MLLLKAMDIEVRIIELETKVAYQDQLLEELNQIVYQQQIKLDEMDKLYKEVMKRFASDIDTSHVRPPHY